MVMLCTYLASCAIEIKNNFNGVDELIKEMLTAQYSAVSYLSFMMVTVAFSFRDESVGEIRGRFAFCAIFYTLGMYFLNK